MVATQSPPSPYVERAGVGIGFVALSADELRHRARTAPPEVRALIDRQRSSRGLPPLWGRSTAGTSRPQATAVARRLRQYVSRVRGEIAEREVDAALAARRARRTRGA